MGYADQKLKGIVSIIAGLSIRGIGIPLAITWIIFCFGSIIIGILLLTFSPAMLFGPLFMSGAFGLTFITTGTERFCQGKILDDHKIRDVSILLIYGLTSSTHISATSYLETERSNMKTTLLIASIFSALIISTPVFAGCVGTVVMGNCSGTEVDGVNDRNTNNYEGLSGANYEYDLSDPGDQVDYSVDLDAQRRDQMSSNPNRQLDQSAGQAGGGIYD